MFNSHRILCAGLLALAAGGVAAQDVSPGYVGVAYAVGSNYSIDYYSGDSCRTHTSDGGKLYAGYTLESTTFFGMDSSHAIELGLFSLGHYREVTNYGYIDTNVKGITLTHASSLKLNDAWSFNTRLGGSYTSTKQNVNDIADGTRYGYKAYDYFGLTGGVGMAYAIDKHWSVTADVDYLPFRLGSGGSVNHVKTMTVGVAYHF